MFFFIIEMEMKERKYGAIYTIKYAEELVYMTLLDDIGDLDNEHNKRIVITLLWYYNLNLAQLHLN